MVLNLLSELIKRPSMTPKDEGCQTLIKDWLEPFGFSAQDMSGLKTRNTWFRKGHCSPVFVFAGHTDVVPTGDLSQWTHPPFEAQVDQGYLYGRGAQDMKASVAAFVVASQRFVTDFPNHKGSIALMITSDEEGEASEGTVRMCEILQSRNEVIDYCLVGEPSSRQVLGDTVKNGRRGSLNGVLRILGQQGHIAYPQLADNPIHHAVQAISELVNIQWDEGNQDFDPTSFQCSNIASGTGATNVIPGELKLTFNFRFSPCHTPESLKSWVHGVLDRYPFSYEVDWTLSGMPFITSKKSRLSDAVLDSIYRVTSVRAQMNTLGGTSDGRFISKICDQVVEFGPLNDTIHQVDERIRVDSLEPLSQIYYEVLKTLLTEE